MNRARGDFPHRRRAAALALAVLLSACGSSAPNPPPAPPPPPAITFTAENANPGPDSISLQLAMATATDVTLAVAANSVTDLFGYGVDVVYDPAIVAFDAATAGTFLDGSGITVQTQVTEPTPGTLVIGQTRVGAVAGVSGSGTLLTLSFKAVVPGPSTLTLANGGAFDSTGAAVMFMFFGGSLSVPTTAE